MAVNFNTTKRKPLLKNRNHWFLTILPLIEAHNGSDKCLEWTHGRRDTGYGAVWFDGRDWRVHRLAYKFTHDDFNPELGVLHACDNPPCFNPRHLFQGTHSDNMADMVAKGRLPRGKRGINSVLTAEDVIAIRQSSLTHRELAKMFGVTEGHIGCVIRRKIWPKVL